MVPSAVEGLGTHAAMAELMAAVSSVTQSPFAPKATTSNQGDGPLNVCEAVQMLACAVEGTGAPPTVSAPVTAALPLTVRLPVSDKENALMPLVVVSDVNVGALGSLGRMTLGI